MYRNTSSPPSHEGTRAEKIRKPIQSTFIQPFLPSCQDAPQRCPSSLVASVPPHLHPRCTRANPCSLRTLLPFPQRALCLHEDASACTLLSARLRGRARCQSCISDRESHLSANVLPQPVSSQPERPCSTLRPRFFLTLSSRRRSPPQYS